jgi:hypothetical protein
VHSTHTRGLTEGLAEVRAVDDFQAFTWRAGYRDLVLPKPQYEGAYAATDRLLNQIDGPFRSREEFTDELVAGPAAMHFDRLAACVVRNRLWDVVPHHEDHQQAVRAALIGSMLHDAWPDLPDHSTRIGERVADGILIDLNAKVDEIRRHYQFGNRGRFDADQPNRYADRTSGASRQERFEADSRADVAGGLRFLSAQAPAGGAVTRRPSLGHGERLAGAAHLARPGRLAGPSQPAR